MSAVLPPLRIALVGLGNVGSEVLRALLDSTLVPSTQRPLQLVAVAARDPSKVRAVQVPAPLWTTANAALPARADIDVVIELVGGANGLAHELAIATLQAGKTFITANKALLATHGVALQKLATQHGGTLRAEAAVAGAIPIIKTLREALAANELQSLQGILNGTCNYILTQMQERQISFDVALREAQQAGYAEADPTLDVEGGDTAHKLALLATLMTGQGPTLSGWPVSGITDVSLQDIMAAAELGYRIKLLGVVRRMPAGLLMQVGPQLVPMTNLLADVRGADNAILVHGSLAGNLFLAGRGAGGRATASAVLADLFDSANQPRVGGGFFPATVSSLPPLPAAQNISAYYLRLMVREQPGVVAAIASILAAENISIATLLQRRHPQDEPQPVIITTHPTSAAAMAKVVAALAAHPALYTPPTLMPIND